MSGPSLRLLDGVRWQGEPVAGDRSHALLAALALAAPRTVSVADLVDAVWSEGCPDHPEKALQVLVSRTRARTSARAVALEGAGYRLGLRDDEVDALLLRRLAGEARAAHAAGDLDVARHVARDALAISLTSSAHDGPLGELTTAAVQERRTVGRLLGRVLLARGDAAEALPLLEAAQREDATDEERLVEVLRAEAAVRGVPAALARYATYVDRVRDELGAEPGETLRRLHVELLARDAPVREGLKYDAAPMIGRDGDVAAIRGLVDRSRMVSIVGAGGLGKTRMAHLVGRLTQHPVVYFVELAGVNAPEGVVPEVAAAIGVRESATSVRTAQHRSDLRARVAQQLTGPPTLLILDNCEHLVDAVADLVAFLVATTETTSVLTTTRAPLGIAAEQVYLLPQLGDADAVELFAQRARAARSDVRLEADEVTALVVRLDGLPLAIELAAAKVRVMSVAEISRRLEDRFALLAGRDRSAPDRHRTLEAVIAWSWNLLRSEDQEALRALAVFPDGFALAGAETALGRDPLASLAELVDQSLLVVREGGDRGDIRYRFLETVREYGLKELAAAGATDAARQGLREWAVGFARARTRDVFGPGQVEAMGRLRKESGNIAGVMRSALVDADTGVVVPLAGALTALWTIEGDHLTVLGLTTPVLDLVVAGHEAAPEHVSELRGVLAALIVNTTIFTGKPPERAVERLRELGLAGDGGRVDAMCRVTTASYDGDAQQLAHLEALGEDDDPEVARLALQWTSQARENAGDLDGAVKAAVRALGMCDDRDGPWTRALLQSQLCGLATQAGDWDLCVHYGSAALPVMEALGAAEDSMQLRCVLALADLARGRLDEAEAELNAITADERSEQGLGWTVPGLSGQAELALARGDVDRGLRLYLECLDAATKRRFAGLDTPVALAPWVLFAQASALFAHVVHGRQNDVVELADQIRASLSTLLDRAATFVDYPVIGGVMLALGSWQLARGDLTGPRCDAAVRLVALGERFGYHRTLPTMAWGLVRRVVDEAAPGALDDAMAAYAGRSAVDLRDEARAVAVRLG